MSFSQLIAEVGDKEPSLVALWCVALALSAVGFLVSRRRRTFLVVLGLVAAIWGWAVYQELRDPYVGPAILQELGRSYVVQAYIALVLPFVFMGLGLAITHLATEPNRSTEWRPHQAAWQFGSH